jgi:hypothetical protein
LHNINVAMGDGHMTGTIWINAIVVRETSITCHVAVISGNVFTAADVNIPTTALSWH